MSVATFSAPAAVPPLKYPRCINNLCNTLPSLTTLESPTRCHAAVSSVANHCTNFTSNFASTLSRS
eukprot:11251368-Prorocentrum_lima.AAC.1